MICSDSITGLEKVIRQKPQQWKKYEIFRKKNKNFNENEILDWLSLFDKILDSREKSKSKWQLHSNFSKKLAYDISLLYNRVKCNLPFRKIPWWHKITDQIYLGALPLVQHISSFKNIGINSVLSLVESFERNKSFVATPVKGNEWKENKINNLHLSHPDFIPVSLVVLYKSACFLDDQIEKSKRIYVHCKAGRGRSASAILAYLLLFKNFSFDKAFNMVKSKRSHIAIKNKRFKIEVLKCLYEILRMKNKREESLARLSTLMN